MKKLNAMIATLLCLCAVCALCAAPASALEYSISAPGDPEYGKPTSFEPVVTADGGAMKNEDLSKNAALIPPGFGTPTSYMLNTGQYLTPNLVPSQMAGDGQVNGNVAVVTPPATGGTGSYPITDTSTSPSTTAGFTEVTSALYYGDGSLGTLKIPSIGLTVKVFEGTGSAPLLKGAGRVDEARTYIKRFCLLSEGAMLVMSILVTASTPWVTRISNMSPESAQLTFRLLLLISAGKLTLWVLAFTLPQGMRAAGDVRFAAGVSAASMWIFRVGLCLLLCRGLGVGLYGVWIAWLTDWLFRGTAYLLRFRGGKWTDFRVLQG